MSQNQSAKIRSVALVGHGAAGKTTLAESLLAASGAIPSRGSVEKGNTVCDFDAIENYRGDAFYKQALGISLLPSSPTLRQRMDARAAQLFDHVPVLIEQLRFRSRSEDLQPQERAEKTRIMQRILHNDAQIRYLAEPWLVHFEKKFDNLQQLLH